MHGDTRMLARVVLVLAAGLALAGCDGGSGDDQSGKPVPFAEFRSIPLDTPRAAIEEQFGQPLRSEPGGALDPGTTCLFYRAAADAAPATEYQFCFLDGKLHSKYAG